MKERIINWRLIFVTALKIGLPPFGRPVFFYKEYVKHRKWFNEKTYADLVVLCQFLSGPVSS
ncbi:chromate transporter [Paranoxybacillus vitaminiphilus]|uniref:chromate transporter n=1 Tax=Paranoxybacillus vitaminiphilus TaxID=581036 RepID=UPI00396473FA